MKILGECWGTCHWGHYPCHHPRTLGKGWCQVHSWFPNGLWRAFQMLLRVVWTPRVMHAECNWVKREAGGSQSFLGRTSRWPWASQFLYSCPVSSSPDWRSWTIGPLQSFLSQIYCDSGILCKPVEMIWLFTSLSEDNCGLFGLSLGALVRVVVKAWLSIVLKIHLSKIFTGHFWCSELGGSKQFSTK